jgi:hypothetical protein
MLIAHIGTIVDAADVVIFTIMCEVPIVPHFNPSASAFPFKLNIPSWRTC